LKIRKVKQLQVDEKKEEIDEKQCLLALFNYHYHCINLVSNLKSSDLAAGVSRSRKRMIPGAEYAYFRSEYLSLYPSDDLLLYTAKQHVQSQTGTIITPAAT